MITYTRVKTSVTLYSNTENCLLLPTKSSLQCYDLKNVMPLKYKTDRRQACPISKRKRLNDKESMIELNVMGS